jgi:glycerol dehydrogenase
MHYKAVFPGQYLQGQGVLNELPEIAGKFGTNILILASKTSKDKILPSFGPEIMKAGIPVESFKGECCEEEISRVGELISRHQADVLVGMGGGKCIDTAKIAADMANIPVIIVPTIASTDAPCSGCAIIYTADGIFDKVYFQKSNPQAVLVDMNVISHSPARFLVAGMGDALATWFEARSCERTKSPNECGGLALLTGMNLARLCYDTLLEFGIAAKLANESKIITPALQYITEANILLSGIGFESCGIAAAHSIHNGLTALEETHAYYHGEKVAFGTITGLHLTGAPMEEIETVYEFCEAVGLPTTFGDIGIYITDPARLMRAAERACAPEQTIHKEAGEMTAEKVLHAMIMADAMGRERLT